MKELIGKTCKLVIKVGYKRNPSNPSTFVENLLTYNANVADVSETHITFKDRYGQEYIHLIKNVVEVSEISK